MQNDEIVWNILNYKFCSFKTKIRQINTARICRNPYNATGLCNKTDCPLANSRYATVIEKNGKIFLYMKTVERAHTPAKMWERVLLSRNYSEALKQITENLKWWPKHLIQKCKLRFTRIVQTIIRSRKLAKTIKPELVRYDKKSERRLERRENRALGVAQLEKNIEEELLRRLLQKSTYGDIYNYPLKNFQKVVKENENEEEIEARKEIEYVEGDSEDEDINEEELEKEDLEAIEEIGRGFDDDYDFDGFMPDESDEEGGEQDDDEDQEESYAQDDDDEEGEQDDEEEEEEKPAKKQSGKGKKPATTKTTKKDDKKRKATTKTTKKAQQKRPAKKGRPHREIEYEHETISERN